MKSCTIILIVVSAVTLFLSNPANSQTGQQRTLPDSVFFNTLVAQYAQSVDQADTLLALKIWAPTDEISFFNLAGTEYGWKGVKNIYKMLAETVRKWCLEKPKVRLALVLTGYGIIRQLNSL